MSEQAIEVNSDSIKINVNLCQEYLSPKEYIELHYIVDKIEKDLERKGRWNKFDYEELMSIRSLTNRRIFTGETNEARGVDVESEAKRIQDFDEGAKRRAKSLFALSGSVFLLTVAAFTLHMVSERYPSMSVYRGWLVCCIPFLTTSYMIYLKDFQLGEHWEHLNRPIRVVWWIFFVSNLFSLVVNSFNVMEW